MLGAGLTSFLWDMRYMHACFHALLDVPIAMVKERYLWRQGETKHMELADLAERTYSGRVSPALDKPLPSPPQICARAPQERAQQALGPTLSPPSSTPIIITAESERSPREPHIPSISWQTGTFILVIFVITFVLTISLHATIQGSGRTFSLFSSLYLAGTVIFGGLFPLHTYCEFRYVPC